MNSDLNDVRKKELIDIMTNELNVLRAKVGLSQQELADKIGVSRQTYGMIETKKQRMTWQNFITILLLFRSDPDTARMIDWIGAYPPELEQHMKLSDDAK